MKQVFEDHFLPNFRGGYYSELYFSTWCMEPNPMSVRLRVLPLHHNDYQEEEIPYIPFDRLQDDLWQPFHDEVFRKTPPTEEALIPPIIDHSDWHPYLASRLLNAVAKVLYGRVNFTFGVPGNIELSKELFGYIVECLPYAQATQQNLDLFRAIAYLFPKTCLEWNLPVDFWTLSVEFLKVSSRGTFIYWAAYHQS